MSEWFSRVRSSKWLGVAAVCGTVWIVIGLYGMFNVLSGRGTGSAIVAVFLGTTLIAGCFLLLRPGRAAVWTAFLPAALAALSLYSAASNPTNTVPGWVLGLQVLAVALTLVTWARAYLASYAIG